MPSFLMEIGPTVQNVAAKLKSQKWDYRNHFVGLGAIHEDT
jgi:hypothetical protein